MTRLTTQVSVLEKEVDSLREALKKKSKEKAKTPQPEAHSQTNGDGTEMEQLKASLQKVEVDKDALAAMLNQERDKLQNANTHIQELDKKLEAVQSCASVLERDKKELEKKVEELSAQKGASTVVDEG